MTGAEKDKVFAGNIPAIYEKFLVPMIFEPFANEIAERLVAFPPKDVLEIAAGTGVLTRAMAAVLGGDVRIVATDLNQPMLDMAAERQGADGRVRFQQADGMALPFESQSFDAVVCQFGVMFFPDKLKGYSEARRVLRPGGRYIFNVWDRIESNEFITVVCQTLDALFPDNPPRFMQRSPHGYFDLVAIAKELKRAGFSEVSTETVDHVSRAVSAHDAATGYCQGNPLRNEIEERAPGRLEEVTQRAAEALEKRFGKGAIQGRIRAHIVTAIA
jgi:ubiquinone/menaquinone biosynthesis C-methylase UbiE